MGVGCGVNGVPLSPILLGNKHACPASPVQPEINPPIPRVVEKREGNTLPREQIYSFTLSAHLLPPPAMISAAPVLPSPPTDTAMGLEQPLLG